MPRVPLNIAGGFYQSNSLPIANQQCNNWYVNIPQTGGALTQANLYGCAGVVEVLNTGKLNQINRGSHVKSGKPYFVNGLDLYRLDRVVAIDGVETFSTVKLGEIPGNNRVSMADNGKELIIVSNGKGWIVDETAGTVFQEITDSGFTANGNPQYVEFINSFFVCTTDSKKYIRSGANQGLVWNALNFGTAEADPDNIVAPIVFKNQLFLGGSETFEVFEFTGASGFGFQRINGLIINKGLFAPASLVKTSDTFMFIGGGVNESPSVWALSGSSVQKVSTTAIDSVLQDFSSEEISTAFAYSYSQNGAFFVGFTVGDRTFEFNTVTNLWNERSSQFINTKGVLESSRWRVNSVCSAYNKLLCGDSQEGFIGSIDEDVYTEYERNILRTVTTTPLFDQGNALTISQLELTVESGVGDFTTTDPVIRLSKSRDGKVFDNEVPRSVGKIGEYSKRLIWRKIGKASRFMVFKFEFSEPVKPVIVSLYGQIKGYVIGN